MPIIPDEADDMISFSVAIQAGGRSRRMGTDKSFAELQGRPLIAHVIERVAGLGQAATFIVTNTPEPYRVLGLPLIADVLPGAGSLGGIYSALVRSLTPYTLVVGCDMPLLNPDLLRFLVARVAEDGGPHDAIVPRFGGVPQGLHALYADSCRAAMRLCLAKRELQIKAFFGAVHTRFVDEPEYEQIDPEGRSFRNVNTPEELAATEQLLASGG